MLNQKAVRQMLSDRSMTVSALARKMGSHRPDVSAWVNGRCDDMKLSTAARMAKALECRVDDLIDH